MKSETGSAVVPVQVIEAFEHCTTFVGVTVIPLSEDLVSLFYRSMYDVADHRLSGGLNSLGAPAKLVRLVRWGVRAPARARTSSAGTRSAWAGGVRETTSVRANPIVADAIMLGVGAVNGQIDCVAEGMRILSSAWNLSCAEAGLVVVEAVG